MSVPKAIGPLESSRRTLGFTRSTAWREAWRERAGGHRVATTHGPHLAAACEWLVRAQDATPSGGIARGYSVVWNRYFRLRGWEAEYPETTGYIIPTLYLAAAHLGQPELAERAERAARWESDVQLRDGAVRGGVITQAPLPSVFNTGQVIFGWLAALDQTGDQAFADSVTKAADFLCEHLDADGIWRRGTSQLAHRRATLYNTRTAWALAAAGARLGVPAYQEAARRGLRATADRQRENGWIPECCLSDPERPLLHTLAYAIRGTLEGGWLVNDAYLTEKATIAAGAIRDLVREDGWLAGRWSEEWKPAAGFSCLTGTAQMANIWLRLARKTGDDGWLVPVRRVLRFLESTQNRTSANEGLRGGIKGSSPFSGEYGRYETLSWATKFFVDAIIRYDRLSTGAPDLAVDPLA